MWKIWKLCTQITFPHQKYFHCNTNTIHNKTISIHAIICVNIYNASSSTKIHIIPLWVLGWLKYFLSWHSDHVLHHETSHLRQQNQGKYQSSVTQWLTAFRLKINSHFISEVAKLVISEVNKLSSESRPYLLNFPRKQNPTTSFFALIFYSEVTLIDTIKKILDHSSIVSGLFLSISNESTL